MADERPVVITVECQHCKVRQKVHVAAPTGVTQTLAQKIACINCGKSFVVTPDRIVDGPFTT